jgi:hypothetical protein
MVHEKKSRATSAEIWTGLGLVRPDLTAVSSGRKTPRTTMMRDLRKDQRFVVSRGTVQRREP